MGIQQSDAALLRREFVRAAQYVQRVVRGAARRSQLPGAQKRPCGKGVLADAFGRFRKTKLPRKIFRVELGDPLPAKERILLAVRRRSSILGLRILLDGACCPLFTFRNRLKMARALVSSMGSTSKSNNKP